MCSNIYIASCRESGGIYHYKITKDSIDFIDFVKLDRPMYMVLQNNKMYIVLRAPFDNDESGVIVYYIDHDGKLTNPSEIISTKGAVGCHIAVSNDKIYCANYISGSVILLPDTVINHKGHSIHAERQQSPHSHFVGFTPDKKYICVADLGLDTVFLYTPDMQLYSSIKVPPGHGVRHLAFSQDGNYLFAANELQSTAASFSYKSGELRLLDVHSLLPDDFTGESFASAIRVKKDKIYVSNRGHDSISVLNFENERLSLIDNINCYGNTPRDFVFTDNYLICANQDSNNVTVLDTNNNFELLQSLKVEAPICVCTDK